MMPGCHCDIVRVVAYLFYDFYDISYNSLLFSLSSQSVSRKRVWEHRGKYLAFSNIGKGVVLVYKTKFKVSHSELLAFLTHSHTWLIRPKIQ